MNQKEIGQYLIDFHNKDIPKVLKRDLTISQTGKIKAIIGPRRAGKTFYLYQLMRELKETREEVTTLSGLQGQVHDHEERIERVEKKLNIAVSV